MNGLTIKNVMPWGRSLKEYVAMFALSPEDMGRSILSCADGPASFNVEMTALGHSVTSVDPVYVFSADDIRRRIEETRDVILANTREYMERYCWDTIRDIDELESVRMTAMENFLSDVELGKEAGRYIPGSLPELDFPDGSFELVLCSHCLFTYTEQLDRQFHVDAIREMLRVGREVRVFPLLDMNGDESRHVTPVERELRDDGVVVERVQVDYEFQRGGNQFLRLTNS